MSDHALRNNILGSMYHLKALMLKHRLMLTQLYGASSKREASLYRLERSSQGLIGALVIDGIVFCSTLEHPELKVPSGVYICKYLYSVKFKTELYELIDVPNRTECKFHPGNKVDDTTGCIILGQYPGYLDGGRAVLKSGGTIKQFHETLNGEDLLLSIYDITNL